MLRVLLVEDSVMLAERLREALDQMDGIELVGTVDTELDAIQAARDHQLDVIILDLQLKRGTGFGVLKALGSARPAIVVLTNYALPEYQRRAREYGVEYFLNKSRDYERLPDVLATLKAELQP